MDVIPVPFDSAEKLFSNPTPLQFKREKEKFDFFFFFFFFFFVRLNYLRITRARWYTNNLTCDNITTNHVFTIACRVQRYHVVDRVEFDVHRFRSAIAKIRVHCNT